jgi:hypothetical protein
VTLRPIISSTRTAPFFRNIGNGTPADAARRSWSTASRPRYQCRLLLINLRKQRDGSSIGECRLGERAKGKTPYIASRRQSGSMVALSRRGPYWGRSTPATVSQRWLGVFQSRTGSGSKLGPVAHCQSWGIRDLEPSRRRRAGSSPGIATRSGIDRRPLHTRRSAMDAESEHSGDSVTPETGGD